MEYFFWFLLGFEFQREDVASRTESQKTQRFECKSVASELTL